LTVNEVPGPVNQDLAGTDVNQRNLDNALKICGCAIGTVVTGQSTNESLPLDGDGYRPFAHASGLPALTAERPPAREAVAG